jgi:hypothetical protein
VAGVNLVFNTLKSQDKYEIETLENDQIRLIFGDGDFAAMPAGIFNIWVRSSASGGINVPKSLLTDATMTFAYTSKTGSIESGTFTYSLTSSMTNSAVTEDPSHIKSIAPSVYYSQNRMVNGQDYNSYLLQDPSILRLNAVNRTFAGQPKYIDWNDASGAYQNIKIFGDDLRMYYDLSTLAGVSTVSARSLIDDVIEPALSNPGLYNMQVFAFYNVPYSLTYNTISGPTTVPVRPYLKPRLKFIEDVSQGIQEKTKLQGYLDRHWYGEPDSLVQLDSNLSDISALSKSAYALVNKDTDHLIWNSSIKCVLQDPITGFYSLIPTPNGLSGIQETVIRQKRFGISFNPSRMITSGLQIALPGTPDGSFPNPLTTAAVNQAITTADDVYTIEVTDTTGTFSVHSANRGYQAPGTIGESYTDGILSFILGPSTVTPVIGDAFTVSINKTNTGLYTPFVFSANLTGTYNLIDDTTLASVDALSLEYNVTDPIASWLFIVERTDDSSGNVAYWTITTRNFSLTVESLTTKFWYNQNLQIVDPNTQLPVVDMIRILKSNLNATGNLAIGSDQIYNVVSDLKYSNGLTNYGALSITPSNVFSAINTSTAGTSQDPLEFLTFVGNSSYVYFSIDPATGNLIPVVATSYLESLTYVNGVTSDNAYARKLGRNNLDFLWQHFTPNDNLIDPSTSNIIDIYALTSGYYSQVQDFVNGLTPIMPTPPSSLDLRNSYSSLLNNKMISDTVVMHSGLVKLIFGSASIPELQATFRVVLSPTATLTGDQVRAAVLSTINQYFVIDNWDFGQSFYATELCAVIHQQLAAQISSVVIVPLFPTNYFGDLFYLQSAPNEVFVSCATIDNIEIVTNIDRLTLKQKQ